MVEKEDLTKLFMNHIYPGQCQVCLVEATSKCKLVVEDCKCVNFVPLSAEKENNE